MVQPAPPLPTTPATTWAYFGSLLVAHGYGKTSPANYENLPKIQQRRLKELVQRFVGEPETLAHMLEVLVKDWRELRVALSNATRLINDPVRTHARPALRLFLAGKEENVMAYFDCWEGWVQGQKPDPIRRKERDIDISRDKWQDDAKFWPLMNNETTE
jgi:hypothetical protein